MTEQPEADGELRPDIEQWALAHGFTPSERALRGETSLLRLGMMDMTAAAYAGAVAGRDALLAEFSIGSPSISDAFGGSGVQGSWFTLFLLDVDAAAWPRLTVQPGRFHDGDWLARLLHRDDHPVRGIGAEFDRLYHVRADRSVTDERLGRLFDADFVSWCVAQGELVFDVEQGDTGGHLVVARRGIGIGDEALTSLLAQAEHVAARLASAST